MTDVGKLDDRLVDSGTEAGIDWRTLRAPVFDAVNGYIRLPVGHPWLNVELLEALDVAVHGGITYGPDEGRWIGFDTLHGWDRWPATPWPVETGGRTWTRELVAEEARRFARTAAEAIA